jgi:hypothetical protein
MFADILQRQIADAEAQENAALEGFFFDFPDADSTAVRNVLINSHRERQLPITFESLKETLADLVLRGKVTLKSAEEVEADRVARAQQAEQEKQAEREHLLGIIVARMREKGNMEIVVQGELLNRYRYMNNAELQKIVDDWAISKELRGKSRRELRDQIQRQYKTGKYKPRLPGEWTSEKLITLVKTNPAAYRKLVQEYGNEVNERANGKTIAPGVAVARGGNNGQ